MNAAELTKRNEVADRVMGEVLGFHINQCRNSGEALNATQVAKDAYTIADGFISWGRKITPKKKATK